MIVKHSETADELANENVSKNLGVIGVIGPGQPLAVPQTLATALRPSRPLVATASVLSRIPLKGSGAPAHVGKLKLNTRTPPRGDVSVSVKAIEVPQTKLGVVRAA